MRPVFDNTVNYPKDKLVLHYYAAEGSTTREMYEDDGVNPKAIATKQFELISLYGMKNENNSAVIINTKGMYTGKPALREVELFVYGIARPNEIQVNKQAWNKWNVLDNGGVYLTSVPWKGTTLAITVQ
jgi:oligosaccharide 4-alpha-D-glucosyltransferase